MARSGGEQSTPSFARIDWTSLTKGFAGKHAKKMAIAAGYYSECGFINASSAPRFDHRRLIVGRHLQYSCRRATGEQEESSVGCCGGGGRSTPSWVAAGASGVISEAGGIVGDATRVDLMVVCCMRSRQLRDWLNLVEMVDDMNLLMECFPATTSCLGCFDGRMMLEKKMFGAVTVVIDGWIKAIDLDGANSAAMGAILSTMEEMLPSSLAAAAVDTVLWPHRIWVRLDLGLSDGCPSMVGLPEMKLTVAVIVKTVESSSLLDGDRRIWEGW
ncbi:hypothetical protein ACLOJK_029181 [Asimina triloba]